MTPPAPIPARSAIQRLIVSLTLAIGTVTISAIAIFAAIAMHQGEQELVSLADKTVADLANILERPLWDFDTARARSIGDIYARDPGIASVEISEASGAVIYQSQKKKPEDVLARTHKIVHDGRELGHVTISMPREPYRQEIWRAVRVSLLVGLLALFAAFITTSMLIKAYLRRPLNELTAIVNAYSAGDYSRKEAAVQYREFQPFGAVLSEMGERIQNQLHETRELNKRLAAQTFALSQANELLKNENVRREQLIRALEDSEERYSIIVNTIHDALVIHDAHGNILQINKKMQEMFGVSPEEVRSMSIAGDLSGPGNPVDKLSGMWQRVLQGEVHSVEWNARNPKNGACFPVEVWLRKINLGGTDYVLANIRDISERRKAQEALLKHQQQLQELASRLLLLEESERRKFSQLLHDHIGQNLAYAKLRLGVLLSVSKDSPHADAIREILTLIEQMGSEARALTYDLSPPLLYEIGLDAALEWLGEQFAARYKLPCSFESSNQAETLDIDIRVALFQAARELLFNVVKHAKATRARIEVARNNGTVNLTIADDGVGINTKHASSGGFGLFNVRERMKHIGGELAIDSEPGAGTRITLSVPLKSAALARGN